MRERKRKKKSKKREYLKIVKKLIKKGQRIL